MIQILFEDPDILVVVKPAGIESQASRSLEPDMVSEIKKYRSGCAGQKLSTECSTVPLCLSTKSSPPSTKNGEPYVGVIHRLDKPVSGVMVYAKTPEAAASLSRQVQDGWMRKHYLAVVCGKLVDGEGSYVDYLLKDGRQNYSRTVDKETRDARRAELRYRVLSVLDRGSGAESLSLAEVELLTGRHHQIRVQFAAHGTPLWGDAKYNPQWGGTLPDAGAAKANKRDPFARSPRPKACRSGGLALTAARLSLLHPGTGALMEFSVQPQAEIFQKFNCQNQE